MVKAITLVLFSVSVLSLAQGFSLTILHTNDNHARFEETNVRGFLCNPSDAQAGECYGGMARKATMIKKIRSETKNVLLISGGDVLTGTIWYRVYRGNATRFFMNELGYDIMVSKSSTSAKQRVCFYPLVRQRVTCSSGFSANADSLLLYRK